MHLGTKNELFDWYGLDVKVCRISIVEDIVFKDGLDERELWQHIE